MKRIAIDMDEVMADTLNHYLDLYNDEFGLALTTKHFHGHFLFDVIDPAHRERAREYFQMTDFFRHIKVMPRSQEVVQKLSETYEIFVTTAAMDVPRSFTAKFEWLAEHFPFLPPSNIVFCGDKSIIAADYLIDDNPRHFGGFRGEGILFTAPHNVHNHQYRRVNDWSDVESIFCPVPLDA